MFDFEMKNLTIHSCFIYVWKFQKISTFIYMDIIFYKNNIPNKDQENECASRKRIKNQFSMKFLFLIIMAMRYIGVFFVCIDSKKKENIIEIKN
jgi:hypothetical protein